jgi:hypothetical protein
VSVPGRRPPSRLRGPAGELRGRRRECEVLDRLLEAVRAGESRALVVRGDPGVGKTALLDYVVEQASGCRVARAAAVQSEMELGVDKNTTVVFPTPLMSTIQKLATFLTREQAAATTPPPPTPLPPRYRRVWTRAPTEHPPPSRLALHPVQERPEERSHDPAAPAGRAVRSAPEAGRAGHRA